MGKHAKDEKETRAERQERLLAQLREQDAPGRGRHARKG